MQVEKNKVVSFHYRLSEPGRAVIEDSHGGQPAVYLHGHLGVLSGLEEAMAGRQAGRQAINSASLWHPKRPMACGARTPYRGCRLSM